MFLKPMLCQQYKAEKISHLNEIVINPKYDGVRAIWTGKKLVTRNNKEILGCKHIVSILESVFPNYPLDGELMSKSKENFQDFVGDIKRTVNIKDTTDIEFIVFDSSVKHLSYREKTKILPEKLKGIPYIRFCDFEYVKTKNFLLNENFYFEKYKQFEGLIIRDPESFYVHKRSDGCLKYKKFFEEEFKVIGVHELNSHDIEIVKEGTKGCKYYADGTAYKYGQRIKQNKLGRFECETSDGIVFRVGSGFTDEQRKEFWKNPPIGKMITVKFQEKTNSGKPRFPIFKCIRDYE